MVSNETSQNNVTPTYIIVGDTGEKDEEAGERIIAKHGKRLIKAVFLHAVSSARDRSAFAIPEDRLYKGVPIYYFRTYVGAASKACKGGLISTKALQRVIIEAERDLSNTESLKVKPTIVLKGSYPFSKVLKASRRSELENDMRLAEKVNKISTTFTASTVTTAPSPSDFTTFLKKR